MGIQPSVNNHTIPTNPIRYKIGLLPDSYLTIAIRQYYSAMPSDNRQTLSHPPPPALSRPLLLPFTLFTLYTPPHSPPSSLLRSRPPSCLPSDPLPLPATFRNFPSTFHSRAKCKVPMPLSPPALSPSPIRRPDPLVLYTLPSMSSCSHGIRHRAHIVIPSAGGS